MKFRKKCLLIPVGIAFIVLLIVYIWLYRVMKTEDIRAEIKLIQKSLTLVKPSTKWNYTNSWKSIGNQNYGHDIYSAYFDVRTDIIDNVSKEPSHTTIGSIRIFAILPTNFRDTIECIVRNDDFTTQQIPLQEAKRMHEDHKREFSVYSIMCLVQVNRSANETIVLPQAAAIAYNSNPLSRVSPTFVPISYPRDMSQMFAKSLPVLSVCIGPLQFNYSNVLRLVEFVEMYRLMGAKHFYFYHRSASEKVLRVVNHYVQQGVANLLSWNVQNHMYDIWYAAIMAEFNDCIYRAMIVDNYRYAAIVDLDEILMPLKHNSLAEFLRQCDEGRTSAFVFRNVFLHNADSSDLFSVPQHIENRLLYTQTKIRRTVDVLQAYSRSKCVVNTRAIIEMGNHEVWRSAPGFSDHILHPSVGLLFHYRDKCINCKSLLMVDYTARRFGSLIWDRVEELCMKLYAAEKGICPIR